MTITELLTDLHGLGVFVTAKDGRLIIDAPKGVITPAIRAELHTRKAELLAALEPAPRPTPRAPEPAPGPGFSGEFATAAIVAPPWAGRWVKIEDLGEFLRRWGLRVVGGDPDLQGDPWRPAVILAPMMGYDGDLQNI